MNQLKKIFFFSIVAILFTACNKEYGKPSWDTDIAAPLVKTSLNINNLVSDTLLHINSDSSLTLVYNSNLYNFSTDSLLNIPDTTTKYNYNLPSGSFTFSPGQLIVNQPQTTRYSLKGVELTNTAIKSGSFIFSIKSYVKGITDYTYAIPSATLNGVPFSISVQVPAATSTTPGVYSGTYSLANYKIDLKGPNENSVNTITSSMQASLDASEVSGVAVYPADSIIISNTYYQIVPSYARGYFGQQTFNVGPATTGVTIFSRITNGNIQLQNASMVLTINNGFGIDATANINSLTSINTHSSSTVPLVNSVIGSAININRATETGNPSNPVNASVYAVSMNNTNSNITNLIGNLPNEFGYGIKIMTNPLGNVSGSNDFMYAGHTITANLDIQVPLALVANNLTLEDTVNTNFSPPSGNSHLNNGTFTLWANNGFPFSAYVQLYLLNQNNQIVDSLCANNFINPAPLNSSNIVISPLMTALSIPLSSAKMTELQNTKKIIVKSIFNTSNKPAYLKLYSYYSMDLKLTGNFNYTISLH
ncbi:MAG TPA: hypothetical protein VNG53_09275 [Bacteroidia bacterium]|nr:hypothetical protein [Bacteroidia bacterium]